ncbi:hypothetical protein AB0F81_45680 [Actinoplanes sp. NPDC024001]|uniref:hypothetical protein n=1 Tax=Actinoplanes sp. NPDC024001 TaxID=3154598 RepID=UPI0033E0F29C
MRSPSSRPSRRVIRALQAPPEPIEVRAPRRWRGLDEAWVPWVRRSPVGLEVFTRWNEADEYLYLLGDAAYRDHLVGLLSRAVRRDCAAAGFGCTRRSDRSCHGPEVCAREPAAVPGQEGPVPGGCDTYTGFWGNHLRLHVRFSAGDRHRAVVWVDDREATRLWVDGVPVGEQETIDPYGRWLDDRFYVVEVGGPDEHPEQDYTMGELVTVITSVLIHDADRVRTTVLVPEAHEIWIGPRVVRRGDVLEIYPDRDATAPDRTLPID